MDELTIQHYNTNAEAIAKRYESVDSPIIKFVLHFAKPRGTVLDVGCGSGRDLSALVAHGFDVTGVDASNELLKLASVYHPELSDSIYSASLPYLEAIQGQLFDCVLCSAVLMHIPEKLLIDSMTSLANLVTDDGVLILSVCGERAGLDLDDRDNAGRKFVTHTPQRIIELGLDQKLVLIDHTISIDSLGREDIEWHTLNFKKDG